MNLIGSWLLLLACLAMLGCEHDDDDDPRVAAVTNQLQSSDAGSEAASSNHKPEVGKESPCGGGPFPMIPSFGVSGSWKWVPTGGSIPTSLITYKGTGDYYSLTLSYVEPPTNSTEKLLSGTFV